MKLFGNKTKKCIGEFSSNLKEGKGEHKRVYKMINTLNAMLHDKNTYEYNFDLINFN